jgi:hypothetical protein
MSHIKKKQFCKCGNESEMVVTCTLEDSEPGEQKAASQAADRVKGTATCSHCGNEADMWLDL